MSSFSFFAILCTVFFLSVLYTVDCLKTHKPSWYHFKDNNANVCFYHYWQLLHCTFVFVVFHFHSTLKGCYLLYTVFGIVSDNLYAATSTNLTDTETWSENLRQSLHDDVNRHTMSYNCFITLLCSCFCYFTSYPCVFSTCCLFTCDPPLYCIQCVCSFHSLPVHLPHLSFSFCFIFPRPCLFLDFWFLHAQAGFVCLFWLSSLAYLTIS